MFTSETFSFLRELQAHNRRDWFEANKPRYESLVREPALRFIEAMAPALTKFAPQFRADARKMGGSLIRVYRDTRFARDKTPYKTNIGIQFRHALGKDIHAPGFYVHIADSEDCFLGAGCWHPQADTLLKIRQTIAEKPEKWFAVRDGQPFTRHWTLDGDRLKGAPRGFAADHAAIDDLRRKDFIALALLSKTEVTSPEFVKHTGRLFAETGPFMGFLCQAVGVVF
ncbi:MAG: DUF2461 domain-containing protein [Burkholderiaceae bacterium]|jgi:uncharacterized protein (TIGR02453 family)|nr:DUF2461 domain-containing protein [Burkholderiaceae bacterium]